MRRPGGLGHARQQAAHFVVRVLDHVTYLTDLRQHVKLRDTRHCCRRRERGAENVKLHAAAQRHTCGTLAGTPMVTVLSSMSPKAAGRKER